MRGLKTKFNKIIIVWGVFNFLLLSVWVGLFFVIYEKNQIFATLTQINQSDLGETVELNLFNKPDRQELVDNYFLTSSSTVIFLEKLEQLGKQATINLNIGQASEQNGRLNLSLGAEGSFGQLVKFLTSLELLPYAARVNRIEFRKNEKNWIANFFLIVLQDENS